MLLPFCGQKDIVKQVETRRRKRHRQTPEAGRVGQQYEAGISGEIDWILATVRPLGVVASADGWTRYTLEAEAKLHDYVLSRGRRRFLLW